MDQVFILVLFVLIIAAVAYAFNRRADDVLTGDEALEKTADAAPPVETASPPVQDQKVRKVPSAKSAKKPSKKASKKPTKKPRNRREL